MGSNTVSRALVKLSPPAGIAELFADPPLVGNEAREEYDRLFAAIATAAKPADAIAWLFVRDITDLSWEIRREKSLKLQNIRSAEEYVVAGLLRPPKPFTGELLSFTFNLDPEDEKANKEASRWASDPKARQRINKALADKGYDASYILRAALDRAADRTDAIDRRISSYELRRMAALKTIEHYSETLARRLETVSSDVIEGEFTEAAE
jgi:hypothetical protein